MSVKLSKHAHPITGKVWMQHPYGESVEIFEDGHTMYFNRDGLSAGAERFMNQEKAIEKLLLKGYVF